MPGIVATLTNKGPRRRWRCSTLDAGDGGTELASASISATQQHEAETSVPDGDRSLRGTASHRTART